MQAWGVGLLRSRGGTDSSVRGEPKGGSRDADAALVSLLPAHVIQRAAAINQAPL